MNIIDADDHEDDNYAFLSCTTSFQQFHMKGNTQLGRVPEVVTSNAVLVRGSKTIWHRILLTRLLYFAASPRNTLALLETSPRNRRSEPFFRARKDFFERFGHTSEDTICTEASGKKLSYYQMDNMCSMTLEA